MATLFVRHTVKDFPAWKNVYDSFDAERRGLGVTGEGVYQADGDPTDVTVYHHFDSMESAKAFAANPRLKEIMSEAGVTGEPTVWFTTKA